MDELNSFLGLAKAASTKGGIKTGAGDRLADLVYETQSNLFIVQAELAGADKTISKDKIDRTESLIDGIEKELPPIKTFFIGDVERENRMRVRIIFRAEEANKGRIPHGLPCF